MATVITPTNEVLQEHDPVVLEYYRSEGYRVESDTAVEPTFPRVFDGEQYVGEQPAPVELPTIHDGDPSVAGVDDDGTHGQVPDATVETVDQLPESPDAAPVPEQPAADTPTDEASKPRRR